MLDKFTDTPDSMKISGDLVSVASDDTDRIHEGMTLPTPYAASTDSFMLPKFGTL